MSDTPSAPHTDMDDPDQVSDDDLRRLAEAFSPSRTHERSGSELNTLKDPSLSHHRVPVSVL